MHWEAPWTGSNGICPRSSVRRCAISFASETADPSGRANPTRPSFVQTEALIPSRCGRSATALIRERGSRMSNQVRDNPALHRFELELDDRTAAAYYQSSPGVITFTHTEVPQELSGRGI